MLFINNHSLPSSMELSSMFVPLRGPLASPTRPGPWSNALSQSQVMGLGSMNLYDYIVIKMY